MLKMETTLTIGGTPMANTDSPCEEIGLFLSFDVQGSQTLCQLLLEKIASIENGQIEQWEEHWNIHSVIISLGNVTIKNNYNLVQCESTLEDFTSALKQWYQFLKQNVTI
jgi:hypothetical protein